MHHDTCRSPQFAKLAYILVLSDALRASIGNDKYADESEYTVLYTHRQKASVKNIQKCRHSVGTDTMALSRQPQLIPE